MTVSDHSEAAVEAMQAGHYDKVDFHLAAATAIVQRRITALAIQNAEDVQRRAAWRERQGFLLNT